MVYCENCKKQKQKVLIIHGWEGSGDGNWFPWMKRELEQNGFEVFTPTMTTSASPKIEKWMEELTPYMEKMGENDIIIGHSLGSNAALRLIEKTGKKIGHLFLVGSAIGKLSDELWKLFEQGAPSSDVKSLREFWEGRPIDWEKVTQLAINKNIILSDDDPYIHTDTHKDLPEGWNFELWHGHKHFTVFEAPEILKKVLACKTTGWIPVPENELPLTLPEVDKYEPTGTGESPLVNITDWVKTKCPICGGEAHRETNTMPQWAGSSWYWLRFIDPQNDKVFADLEKLKYFMPVDVYVGGAEHAVLHLLYGRFWNMVLYDLGYVPQEEPFTKLVNQGMILAENGEKMSKSQGNVINPDDQVKENGADAFRMYEMFMGPLEDAKPWNTKGIIGISRFLEKVWNLVNNFSNDGTITPELEILLHKTIKKVGEDIENMRFNTAISAMMVLINESKVVSKEFVEKFLIILAPFAPHMTEELWNKLGHKESIFKEAWPKYDESKIKDEEIELVIQINGKVRAKLKLPVDISEADAIKLAKEDDNVKKYLEGAEIKKTIFVANKLISFVI
ncbi:MAG: class I tRNA ligase family protein [Patescibacteria group bacterium]